MKIDIDVGDKAVYFVVDYLLNFRAYPHLNPDQEKLGKGSIFVNLYILKR